MKFLHLPLRLGKFRRGGETLADGLPLDFTGQTEVGAMARLFGLMTMAVRFSASTVDGRDGATAKITQRQDLRQDAGALLFQGGKGLRQRAPPILTYAYVRIIATKKEINFFGFYFLQR